MYYRPLLLLLLHRILHSTFLRAVALLLLTTLLRALALLLLGKKLPLP